MKRGRSRHPPSNSAPRSTLSAGHAAAERATSSSPRATCGPAAKPTDRARHGSPARSRTQRDTDGVTVTARPRSAGSIVHGVPESTPGMVMATRRAPPVTAAAGRAGASTVRRAGRRVRPGRRQRRCPSGRMPTCRGRSGGPPWSSAPPASPGAPLRRDAASPRARRATRPSYTNEMIASPSSSADRASSSPTRSWIDAVPVLDHCRSRARSRRAAARGSASQSPSGWAARIIRSSARSAAESGSGGGRSGTTCRLM